MACFIGLENRSLIPEEKQTGKRLSSDNCHYYLPQKDITNMTIEDQKEHLAKPRRGLLNYSLDLFYLSAMLKLSPAFYSSILNLSAFQSFCDDKDKNITWLASCKQRFPDSKLNLYLSTNGINRPHIKKNLVFPRINS